MNSTFDKTFVTEFACEKNCIFSSVQPLCQWFLILNLKDIKQISQSLISSVNCVYCCRDIAVRLMMFPPSCAGCIADRAIYIPSIERYVMDNFLPTVPLSAEERGEGINPTRNSAKPKIVNVNRDFFYPLCFFSAPIQLSTAFAIENAPPSSHDNLLQKFSILKNKKGFENFIKFSSNLWKPHPSIFNRLVKGKVLRQIAIF